MSQRRRVLLIALFATATLLLGVAPGALAAEAAHPSINWKKEALRYVNFLVVVGVLWWLLKDRLPRFFAERRRKIEEALGEAKAIKGDAESKRAEYGAKIARVDQDIAFIDAERDRRIEAMRVELTQAAEATVERVVHDAEERIAGELDQARAELQREASLLALEIAEELIKKRVKKKHHRKLFEDTVEKLEGIK